MEIQRLDALNTLYNELNALVQNQSPDLEVDSKIIAVRRYLQNNSEELSRESLFNREGYAETFRRLNQIRDVPAAISYEIGVIQQRAAVLKLNALIQDGSSEEIADWVNDNLNALKSAPEDLGIDHVEFFHNLKEARQRLRDDDRLTPELDKALAHFSVWGLNLTGSRYADISAKLESHFPTDPESKALAIADWMSDKELPLSRLTQANLTDQEMETVVTHLQWVDCSRLPPFPSAELSLFTGAYAMINVRSEDLQDLSGLPPNLQKLGISSAPNLREMDFSPFRQLQELVVQNCPFQSIDLSNKEHLEKVSFGKLPNLTSINLSNDNQISEFYGSHLTRLASIEGDLPNCWVFHLDQSPREVQIPHLPDNADIVITPSPSFQDR